MVKSLILFVSCCLILDLPAQDMQTVKRTFETMTFKYSAARGLGHESGVTRRDPSDVISVEGKYYVYYTRVIGRSPGYWGTIWYARSTNEGYTWEERGEILDTGSQNAFDSQAVFTPNILFAEGKYFLYYTGVKPTPGNPEGEFENNATTDITAIGVAVSDSPEGPFTRISKEPILKVSVEPERFDSYRVDDSALLYRNGLYWLYYKGRSRVHGKQGPGRTRMGVAFAKHPRGPFIKYDRPLLSGSHEVMIWRQNYGVGALASISNTLEFSPDGTDFLSHELKVAVNNLPKAPGAFRPDLTDLQTGCYGLTWGISMVHNGDEAYLIRWEAANK